MLSRQIFPVRCALLLAIAPAMAGVTNPDISVLGQMRVYMTDDPADLNRERAQFSFDESEIVADAYLNPYARGTFVFAVVDENIEVEEGYFQILRGLPSGLALKGGKYRVGFGKLNPVHPHAYPFIERFRVLESYLPGEESFNDVGGQLSYRLPLPGEHASTIFVDLLQGNSFHPEETSSRMAMLGRWTAFFLLRDPSALEFGVSAAHGTNNVATRSRTSLFGADVKLKWWTSERDNLIVQAEWLALDRDHATVADDGDGSKESLRRAGGYVFADYTIRTRYGVGAKYERFQRLDLEDTGEKPWDQSVGAFAGVALMEETTLFRLNWDRRLSAERDAFHTLTLQLVFSMGPHKPHQF